MWHHHANMTRRSIRWDILNRLDERDNKNHQIITWSRKTSLPSVNLQFVKYEIAKEVWDFLACRYKNTGSAHHYHIWTTLYCLKKELGQSVNRFLQNFNLVGSMGAIYRFLQMFNLGGINEQSNISADNMRLIQYLMALHDEYESI